MEITKRYVLAEFCQTKFLLFDPEKLGEQEKLPAKNGKISYLPLCLKF